MYLPPAKISDDQIVDLIRHLQQKLENENPRRPSRNSGSPTKDEIDLNKLTPEEVLLHKQQMDKVFRQNAKRPGDPGYEYDVRKEFKVVEDSGWDEDEEEDDIIL
mmetsp:Transcript_17244/g.17173  ORF Transcript_17244/g.17173 Transcript_17244/m.17173 type:complete len:105 (-) Transcript_17244:46-360(-)